MIRLAALLFCAVAASPAATILLYDGSLNTTPGSQGWSLGALSGGGSYTESVTGGGTLLTTTGYERAGYSRLSPLSLDRTFGYRFTFELQLDNESHSTADRAGLSLLVVGSDLHGLEIAFWNDQIWTQNDSPLFTHGETAAFDTSARSLYTLTVQGDTYTFAAGSTTLLAGSLRDYSAGGLPYTVPNFVFVGDDTFSANAATRFYGATLTDVPEPITWASLASGLLLITTIRRSRKN